MSEPAWWQRGAIYQIYPRSFADADGDGVGDLAGIAAHLDHLEALAVEAIWLSPIFTSPMADFGYDVSDYCDVDPVFGTLADFDALVAGCHARGIRIVIDWVLNHTSDRHPWFEQSRSGRADPKRDWYVWRDPAPGGGPPNDWLSQFRACGTGSQHLLDAGPDVLAWLRADGDDRLVAAVSFAATPSELRLPAGTLALSTDPDRADLAEPTLAPGEAVLVRPAP